MILMSSAGLCAVLAFWPGDSDAGGRALCISRVRGTGSQAGEPVEQSRVLVPFGQVVGDDLGVGGLEGLALGLGGGACVDLGGRRIIKKKDGAEVSQWDTCRAQV